MSDVVADGFTAPPPSVLATTLVESAVQLVAGVAGKQFLYHSTTGELELLLVDPRGEWEIGESEDGEVFVAIDVDDGPSNWACNLLQDVVYKAPDTSLLVKSTNDTGSTYRMIPLHVFRTMHVAATLAVGTSLSRIPLYI